MTERTTQESSNVPRVMKTDTKGRIRTTAAQRHAVLEQYQSSGLSGPRFAAVAGIKYQTFATWLRKARSPQERPTTLADSRSGVPAKSQSGVQWIEALPSLGAQAPALCVALRGGMELQISTPSQLKVAATLLRLLEGGPLSC